MYYFAKFYVICYACNIMSNKGYAIIWYISTVHKRFVLFYFTLEHRYDLKIFWINLPLFWIGLPWIGLPWINLPWINLPWINLPWINLPWINLPWINLPWINLPWINIQGF